MHRLALTLCILLGCAPTAPDPSDSPDATPPAPDPDAAPAPEPDPDASTVPTETCNNGLDDNGDGAVDEDCPCTVGEEQPCYAGLPAEAGVGVCGFGTQQCLPGDDPEFGGRWSECAGQGTPLAEICDDLDNDCDGAFNPCDDGPACPTPLGDDPGFPVDTACPGSATWDVPGTYTFVMPAGCTRLTVHAWGAGGGGGGGVGHTLGTVAGGHGGGGAFAEEVIYPDPGSIFAVVVGQGGAGHDCDASWPGGEPGGGLGGLGGHTDGGGGGGYSEVRSDIAEVVVLAGGGGGGAGHGWGSHFIPGDGGAGGAFGEMGVDVGVTLEPCADEIAGGGGGASFTLGGAGGVGTYGGVSGFERLGGAGADAPDDPGDPGGGGGGGGGRFGGGGGGAIWNCNGSGGGGGGGSSDGASILGGSGRVPGSLEPLTEGAAGYGGRAGKAFGRPTTSGAAGNDGQVVLRWD